MDKKNKEKLVTLKLVDVIVLQNLYIEVLHHIAKKQEGYLEHFDIQAAHKELREYPAIITQLKEMDPKGKARHNKILDCIISGSWDIKDRSFIPIIKALEKNGFKVVNK